MGEQTLDDALGALIAAAYYCDDQGHEDLSYAISNIYELLKNRDPENQESNEGEEVYQIDRGRAEFVYGENFHEGFIEIDVRGVYDRDDEPCPEDEGVSMTFKDVDGGPSTQVILNNDETMELLTWMLRNVRRQIDAGETPDHGAEE